MVKPRRVWIGAGLLGALLVMACAAAWLWAQEENPPIQRYLGHLYLGDTREDVERVYPPAQEWPSHIEPRGRVTRIHVEREYAKFFPLDVETIWLGFKKDRLAEVQLIYTAGYSRKKSADILAGDLALIYGDPRRSNNKFWWTDGKTVLRVFDAEIPTLKAGSRSVEFRTSIQLLERGLFSRTD